MSKQDEVPYKIYLAEHEAPTAWYNEKKTSQKAKVGEGRGGEE